VRLDLARDRAAAADPDRLVAAVADRLVGGAISPELASAARAMVAAVPAAAPDLRVAEAVHAIVVSPEYMVLR
jgi:hypothetical protein